jgi:hypothetical protein
MVRLKQLQFDRRPSTVLKTWAHKPEAKGKAPKGPAKASLDVELETFQRVVTLGDWPAVKAYLGGLPAAEGKAAYEQLLRSLQGMAQGFPGGGQEQMMMGPSGPMPRQRPEPNAFSAEDVIGLAAAAPGGLDKELTAGLGAILRGALEGHTVAPDAVARFKTEVDKGKDKAVFSARQAAQVLMAAGEPIGAGTFLPALDQATSEKDSEGLNLLARHFMGVHGREKKGVFLERAWSATRAVLALETAKVEEKAGQFKELLSWSPRSRRSWGRIG